MAVRVCICLAVGCRPDHPQITKEIVEWVKDLIEYLLQECLTMASHNMFRTKLDDDCERILKRIKKAGKDGITRTDLRAKKDKIGDGSAGAFDKVIMELQDREQIKVVMIETKGRPTKWYFAT